MHFKFIDSFFRISCSTISSSNTIVNEPKLSHNFAPTFINKTAVVNKLNLQNPDIYRIMKN